MEPVIALAAIGLGGFALYRVLHEIRTYANRQRAAAWAVVALLAAGALSALHIAGHIVPHVGNHMIRSESSKP
jgi:hypothetical protein